jgi:hypothetical protein
LDSDKAVTTVGETSRQQLSWHWAADDRSILLIDTSIVDLTNMSNVNIVVAVLPDNSQPIRMVCRCLKEPNSDSGPQACKITGYCIANPAGG